jgi:hypothetical protein
MQFNAFAAEDSETFQSDYEIKHKFAILRDVARETKRPEIQDA